MYAVTSPGTYVIMLRTRGYSVLLLKYAIQTEDIQ